MNVSIIIVNYKTSSLVKDCVSSIIEKTKNVDYEMIVVDNSCDESELDKLRNIEGIRVLDAGSNLGFGRANNLGAAAATGEFLFFLNSDTVVLNNAVEILYQFISENRNVGAVCPNLFKRNMAYNHTFSDNSAVIRRPLKALSPTNMIASLTGKQIDYNDTPFPKEIAGYITGAAIMVRRDIFNEIGGFSDEIFMYGEDVLLCGQILRKGYKLMNIPEASVVHFEGESDSKIFTEFKLKNYADGGYIARLKLFGPEDALVYLQQQMVLFAVKAMVCFVMGRRNDSINKMNLSRQYQHKLREIRSIRGTDSL